MTKEEIVDLAKRVGKDTMHDMVLFMKKNMNLQCFLSWIEMWIKKNSTAGFTCTKENGTHTCVMKHDLGENWSLYHKTTLELIFKEVLNKSVDIDTSASMLRLSFRN